MDVQTIVMISILAFVIFGLVGSIFYVAYHDQKVSEAKDKKKAQGFLDITHSH